MNMPLFRPFLVALMLAAPLFATSCKKDKDDPQPDDENELITTVRYTLTPAGGGTAITVQSKDLDGDGGAAPVVGTLTLAPNTTYTGTISFLDESKTPAEDITAEVSAESQEHLVVYTPNPAGLVTITRTDRDRNNLEVGLTTRLVTTAAATGTLQVKLRHQPGSKNGTETPGSSDAEVSFPVNVR